MTSMQPPSSSAVQVRLLQDAVYSEDGDLWESLQRNRNHIAAYFREIGLELVVHDEDGFAYLRQIETAEGESVPRLFRRDRLRRGVALIGVILREQLIVFDERVHDETRLVISRQELAQMATPFFPEVDDQVRVDKQISAAINSAEEMGLLRRLPGVDDDERYEVRRIVKARFPIETLKELRAQLEADGRGDRTA
jgi:hypothetical protein